MAITITRLQSLVTSSNATSYALSAYTPTISTLQVAIVHAPGTIAGPWTMGDAGSTEGWRRNTTLTYNTISAPSGVLILFTAWQAATPVSMTPVFTCAGDSATGCVIGLYEIAGLNAGYGPPESEVTELGGNSRGGYGLSIYQASGEPYNISDGSANPEIFFGSIYDVSRAIKQNTNNAYLIGIANNRNPATYTPPSGWTEDLDVGISGPAAGLWVGYRIGGETDGSRIVTGETAPWAAVYLEVCEAGEYPTFIPIDSNMGETGFFGT